MRKTKKRTIVQVPKQGPRLALIVEKNHKKTKTTAEDGKFN